MRWDAFLPAGAPTSLFYSVPRVCVSCRVCMQSVRRTLASVGTLALELTLRIPTGAPKIGPSAPPVTWRSDREMRPLQVANSTVKNLSGAPDLLGAAWRRPAARSGPIPVTSPTAECVLASFAPGTFSRSATLQGFLPSAWSRVDRFCSVSWNTRLPHPGHAGNYGTPTNSPTCHTDWKSYSRSRNSAGRSRQAFPRQAQRP